MSIPFLFCLYKRFAVLLFRGHPTLRNSFISGSKANTFFFRVFLNCYQSHAPKVEIIRPSPK